MIRHNQPAAERTTNRYRLPLAALVALGCLSTTACADTEVPSQPITVQTIYAPSTHGTHDFDNEKVVTLTPDMSGFLQDPSHCLRGGDRPCAILLRTEPNHDQLSSQIINVDPQDVRVDYPLESYNGQTGDQLTAVCVVPDGETIRDNLNDPASSAWYGILVEPQHIKNSTVQNAFNNELDTVQTATYQGATYLLGFASVEWFHQSQPSGNLPDCD